MSEKLKDCTLPVQPDTRKMTSANPSDPVQGELFPELSTDQVQRFGRIAIAFARLGQMAEHANPQSDERH